MIDNTTLQTINYVKTIDVEYNMKIILIFMFLVYALVALWLDKKYLTPDNRASFKLMSLGAKVFYFTYLVFLPNFVYQLPITQELGFMLIFQQWFYVAAMVLGSLVGAIYLLERLFYDWLGWEITMNGLKIKTVKVVK